jgi:hypothetical protein
MPRIISLISFCLISLVIASCASTPAPASEPAVKKVSQNIGSGPMGTKNNPIKCEGREGIINYLDRLRGPQNQTLTKTDLGSGGLSPFEGVMDIWEVSYEGGTPVQIYFDAGFEGYKEPKAVGDFKIRP